MPTNKGLMQEKFQRTADQVQAEDSHEWANMSYGDTTHIRKIYKPSRNEFYASDETGAQDEGSFTDPRLNYMPPGMFIDNQEPMVTERPYKKTDAGVTDVSKDTTSHAMRKGFTLYPFSGTDDLYTNEHKEEFYGEATGDDDAGNKVTGFLERNNYMDRT